ncbi:MAG TPA: ATP-binding protein, partial [Holophaga sp.]|nr:ATP-binding protein [Holophaga sp.]
RSLHEQGRTLETMIRLRSDLEDGGEMHQPIAEIREAVAKVDGLLKALLRRVGKEGTTPEWIDLCDLLVQEVELLQAEGAIPADVTTTLHLACERSMIFGVYSDFARMLLMLVQHAMGGPFPTAALKFRAWESGEDYHLEVADEGGPIPPSELAGAFEPFTELHQQAVIGVRTPGSGLALCKQLLATYHGEVTLQNEGEGTLLHLHFPLR